MSNSNYMGSGLAQTLDQKGKVGGLSLGQGHGTTSAQSLAISNYSVPSLDGKSLIPAIPKHLALKFKPPTLAVVYQMKDVKTGKMKKYIHDIRINFEQHEQMSATGEIDIGKMVEEICKKETVYLHPAFISRKQVQNFINQLHSKYIDAKERIAPGPEQTDPNFSKEKGRKLNFMERKRFVNYEETAGDEKADDVKNNEGQKEGLPTKEIKDGKIVEQKKDEPNDAVEEEVFVGGGKKKKKAEAVRSAPPKKKKEEPKEDNLKIQDAVKPQVEKSEPPAPVREAVALKAGPPEMKANAKNSGAADDAFDLDNYSDDWGDSGDEKRQAALKAEPSRKPIAEQLKSNAPVGNQGGLDNYSDDGDDWNQDGDLGGMIGGGKKEQNNLNDLNFNQEKIDNGNFYGFANDNNESANDEKNLFNNMNEMNEFDDLEKEFNNQQQNDMGDGDLGKQFGSNKNPFGNSITKELLQQSKKDIEDELGKDIFEDGNNNQVDDLPPNNTFNKKNLEIDIDENADFELENDLAQQQLNDKLMENEIKQNQYSSNDQNQQDNNMNNMAGQGQDDENDEIEMTEQEILQELDNLNNLVQTDPELNKMLANDIESFGLEEKLMIIQAYKKGGVQGVKDIIEEEEEDEAGMQPQQNQQQLDNNMGGNPGMNSQGQEDDDVEELEIDLENEEDIKIIEDQFLQMVNSDERFRTNFGDEIFQLGPIQKYQIIDAYKQNGMDAVLVLLTESADQSGLQFDPNGQSDMMGMDNAGEESVIEHNGKKFQRVQIEGVGDGDDEYLMEIETGDIYSLDFQFMSHMGDDVVIEEN